MNNEQIKINKMPMDKEAAREEANMLSVEANSSSEHEPTARDYDNALSKLEKLQEEVNRGPSSFDNKMARKIKDAIAMIVASGNEWEENFERAISSVAIGFPKEWRKKNKDELIESVRKIPEDYKTIRATLASVHEELEEWKKKAEGYAQKQSERK